MLIVYPTHTHKHIHTYFYVNRLIYDFKITQREKQEKQRQQLL